ncbi:putative lipoprotein [Hyphomonas neptunium ATCC 15444]|uniref:Putative lipoprotein n=2 Tax=Hyphomonas TaxID=85 RepID=Q0C5S4_HYPNA|nr:MULTISPECIES: DUF2796 domain-containing protein [Hyphomonas]ABI76828.1 putative lipoprotein [Hyphomonas neptunium ATCC 15444]KCZ89330.1 putative lipoprotein [Hyphomonas hirschiana VP5]
MSSSARFLTPLLTGAAISVLAACGPGAPPPAETAAVETGEALPEDGPSGDVQTPSGDDHPEGEAGHHEDGEGHDHEEEHAGGTAHVHGIADLAFVFEGGTLTADMMSPLANFGLSEADGVFTDEIKSALPGLITVTGGDCTPNAPVAEIDTSSGHTDAHVGFSWTCINPANVSSARFTGFADFPGFETINAVFVGDTVQKAAELTPSSPELSLK